MSNDNSLLFEIIRGGRQETGTGKLCVSLTFENPSPTTSVFLPACNIYMLFTGLEVRMGVYFPRSQKGPRAEGCFEAEGCF